MVICQVPAEQVVNATGIRKDHAYLARLHLDLYKELVPDQHKKYLFGFIMVRLC